MKICDIIQFYSPLSGGVKRYIRDKMRYLAHSPKFRHVAIIPSVRDAVTEEGHSTVYEVKSLPLPVSQSYRMLLAHDRILDILAIEKPDLIEVGDPYRSAWVAVKAGVALEVPVLSFYHSDYPRAFEHSVRTFCGAVGEKLFSGCVESYLASLYNRMSATVVSTAHFGCVLNGMGVRRLVRIPLGTDPTVFSPRPSRAAVLNELGLPSEAVLLLYVGRLTWEKNIDELVGMLDCLGGANGRWPVYLLLVGDGELRDVMGRWLQARHDVRWLPYCDSAERLAELYSAADLFVHAGMTETFGLVSLEAQACGTRVVAVKGGGLEETLTGEEPLIMAEQATAEAMAAAVEEALRLEESPARRLERRERIISRFSCDRTFERLTQLYEHLIQKKPLETFPSYLDLN